MDSNSSHTFVTSIVASSISLIVSLSQPLQMQVASCSTLVCSSQIHDASWLVQGYEFKSDLWTLTLSGYDMILGLDWLAWFNPMQVDWYNKWSSYISLAMWHIGPQFLNFLLVPCYMFAP